MAFVLSLFGLYLCSLQVLSVIYLLPVVIHEQLEDIPVDRTKIYFLCHYHIGH